jgi:hypothetical protein
MKSTGESSLDDLLSELAIVIVPTRQRCDRGDTHARGVITSIFRAYGPAHLRLVLGCVTADPANRSALWSETIGAVSDALLFQPDIAVTTLTSAFERMDLRWHRERAVRLRPWPVRATMRSFVDQDLERLLKSEGIRQFAE